MCHMVSYSPKCPMVNFIMLDELVENKILEIKHDLMSSTDWKLFIRQSLTSDKTIATVDTADVSISQTVRPLSVSSAEGTRSPLFAVSVDYGTERGRGGKGRLWRLFSFSQTGMIK